MASRRGRPNKATAVREQFYGKQGILPLDFMLAVLRDPQMPHEERKWAAVSAARFVHPALGAIDLRAFNTLNAAVGDATLDPALMTYEQREMLRHAMTMTATLALAGDLIEGERMDDAA